MSLSYALHKREMLQRNAFLPPCNATPVSLQPIALNFVARGG